MAEELDLAGSWRLAIYRAACLVHWPPRERAIARMLGRLLARSDRPATRILDLGCGPGPLVPLARRLGLEYLGLDTDPAMIGHARAAYGAPGISFTLVQAAGDDLPVGRSDIVVMNGVAHHLPDELFQDVVERARPAAFLLICDHWREPGRVSWIARQLQAHDQGRYIRDAATFGMLPGFVSDGFEVFSIGLPGIELWPYFCAAYHVPRESLEGRAA